MPAAHTSDSNPLERFDPWWYPLTLGFWFLALMMGWLHETSASLLNVYPATPSWARWFYWACVGAMFTWIGLATFSLPLSPTRMRWRWLPLIPLGISTAIIWLIASGGLRDSPTAWQETVDEVAKLHPSVVFHSMSSPSTTLTLFAALTASILVFTTLINRTLLKLKLWEPLTDQNPDRNARRLADAYPSSWGHKVVAFVCLLGLLVLFRWPLATSLLFEAREFGLLGLVVTVIHLLFYAVAGILPDRRLKLLVLLAIPIPMALAANYYSEFFGQSLSSERYQLAVGYVIANSIFAWVLFACGCTPYNLDCREDSWQPKPAVSRQRPAIRWVVAVALFGVTLIIGHRLPLHFDMAHFLGGNGSPRIARQVAQARMANQGDYFVVPSDRFRAQHEPPSLPLVHLVLGKKHLYVSESLKQVMGRDVTNVALPSVDTEAWDLFLDRRYLVTSTEMLQKLSRRSTLPTVRIDGRAVDATQLPKLPPVTGVYELVAADLDEGWTEHLFEGVHRWAFRNCKFPTDLSLKVPRKGFPYHWTIVDTQLDDTFPRLRPGRLLLVSFLVNEASQLSCSPERLSYWVAHPRLEIVLCGDTSKVQTLMNETGLADHYHLDSLNRLKCGPLDEAGTPTQVAKPKTTTPVADSNQ